MNDQAKQSKQIQVKTADEMSRGRYSNSMFIAHGPEEFIIDWLLNSPTGAHLVSRIIVAPGHVRRIINALSENLKKYEEKFGAIKYIEHCDQKYH
ncbi:MAG: DUF3467 domain-containing protein [Dissulfuribacterales bacterium]